MILENLSVEEMNLIVEALGNMPFARVFQLVAKIQTQASEQLVPVPAAPHDLQANGKPEPQPEAAPSTG